MQKDRTMARVGRRDMLKWAGAAAAAAIAFGVDIPGLRLEEAFAQALVDLGAGDTGVLNYAYALEQLEAAFYTEVVEHPYKGSEKDMNYLRQIHSHEVEHRDFLRKALGNNAIPALKPNFTAVDFNSRESVLKTASAFEDLGVAAYNGGGAAIQNPQYLAVAGAIVSVEGRHAATLRSLLIGDGVSFAGPDIIDGNGLDRALPPSKVLPQAAVYVRTPFTAKLLP